MSNILADQRSFEGIARHECRLMFAKLEKLNPDGPVRQLAEDLIILSFSAGAAWASGIDWNAVALGNITQPEKQ